MGDSWEDDDFTPVLPAAVILPTKAAWEDEDLVSGLRAAYDGAPPLVACFQFCFLWERNGCSGALRIFCINVRWSGRPLDPKRICGG